MFASAAPTLRRAADALGWEGTLVGPVEFRGARFWAVVRDEEPSDALHIVGCLVADDADPDPQATASLLAAYAPRAVLVRAGADLTRLAVEAALLDQGLVEYDGDRIRLAATPGPRSYVGPASDRERLLLDTVRSARERPVPARA